MILSLTFPPACQRFPTDILDFALLGKFPRHHHEINHNGFPRLSSQNQGKFKAPRKYLSLKESAFAAIFA